MPARRLLLVVCSLRHICGEAQQPQLSLAGANRELEQQPCDTVAAISDSGLHHVSGLGKHESHATLLSCASKEWLITREQTRARQHEYAGIMKARGVSPASSKHVDHSTNDAGGMVQCYHTLVREKLSQGTYEYPFELMNCSMMMSQNAAFVCSSTQLIAFGNALDYSGIKRSVLNLRNLSPQEMRLQSSKGGLPWSTPQVVMSSDPEQSGCVDDKLTSRGRGCEYEGKLSLTVHNPPSREPVLLLYASSRVKLGSNPSSRHIQVASTTDLTGAKAWGRFEACTFVNYKVHMSNHIHFAAVNAHMSGHGLLALFPAEIADGPVHASGIFWATSRDGVHWSPPKLAHNPRHSKAEGYTIPTPVDGFEDQRNFLMQYHRSGADAVTYMCRYALMPGAFPRAASPQLALTTSKAPANLWQQALAPRQTVAPIYTDTFTNRSNTSCFMRVHGPVTTWWLAQSLNGAVALIGGQLYALLGSKRSLNVKGRRCEPHELWLHSVRCNKYTSAVVTQTKVLQVPSALPERSCQPYVNFDTTGPDDGRVLQMHLDNYDGLGVAMLLYTDYVQLKTPKMPTGPAMQNTPAKDSTPAMNYARVVYALIIGVSARPRNSKYETPEVMDATSPIVLQSGPTSAVPGEVQRNWSPFAVGGQVYAFQWLCRLGQSVVQYLGYVTSNEGRVGIIRAPAVSWYSSPSNWLRGAIGVGRFNSIAAGTPAVRWNSTHFIAIGHVCDDMGTTPGTRKHISMFAYAFSAEKPFDIVAATPAFVLMPTTATTTSPGFNIAMPVPKAGSPARAPYGRIQYPIGLQLRRVSEHYLGASKAESEHNFILSWGWMDTQTMITRIDARLLVRKLIPRGGYVTTRHNHSGVGLQHHDQHRTGNTSGSPLATHFDRRAGDNHDPATAHRRNASMVSAARPIRIAEAMAEALG